jgi:hypothetical protein
MHAACCALLTTRWPEFFGSPKTNRNDALLVNRQDTVQRSKTLRQPAHRKQYANIHVRRFLCHAEHRFHSARMRPLRKIRGTGRQYLKPIALQHAQVANNPLPVAGGVDPQIVENTRSDCPRKSYAKICSAEFCHMLIARCSRSACTQTAAQVLACAAEPRCSLYRRRRVNCVQTSADRAAGCGAETGASGRLPVNKKSIVGPVLGTSMIGFVKRGDGVPRSHPRRVLLVFLGSR